MSSRPGVVRSRPRRRPAVALAALLALASPVAPTALVGCGEPEPRPSVVLISLDTLRFDHLGLYGYERNTSPNLDRFAADGVVFERAISQSSSTTPAHRALFSARPASAWRDGETTLPRLLRDAGYRTAAFTGGGNLSARLGFDDGFETYDEDEGGLRTSLPRAEAWLREHAREPFFLFLHTYDIHLPYDPPPPHNRLFSPDHAGALRGDQTRDLLRRVRKLGRYRDLAEDVDVPPDVRERIVALYDGSIHYADRFLGDLFRTLRELGLDDDAIVVVFSDHGEEFWDHGSVIHSHTLFEELVRVPMIWRLPDGRGRGTRVATPVRVMDVAPTIAELVGLDAPPSFLGRSLVPLLDGAPEPPRPALSEIHALRAWTEYPWKLVLGGDDDEPMLFDLERDPDERTNLFDAHPDVAARLEAAMATVTSRAAAARVRELDPAAAAPELQERLRALGYVD